ncbi:MAG: hypothetical protein A2857_02155 [Candidatus Levybacteria bacterium RIFCSPHIGHO2_01_FULL_36_15]|nr:MAG: hypothetical protein A2857_02155 [Candidatus Levybacteria bacterium RIFCSPHIGHO2_01_FULL_36_15]
MNIKRVWYSTKSDLTSPDTVHQILMFGTLEEIKFLKKTIGENILKKIFLAYPKKIYTASALNFIKNFILHIRVSIDEHRYLKFTPRYIGQ